MKLSSILLSLLPTAAIAQGPWSSCWEPNTVFPSPPIAWARDMMYENRRLYCSTNMWQNPGGTFTLWANRIDNIHWYGSFIKGWSVNNIGNCWYSTHELIQACVRFEGRCEDCPDTQIGQNTYNGGSWGWDPTYIQGGYWFNGATHGRRDVSVEGPVMMKRGKKGGKGKGKHVKTPKENVLEEFFGGSLPEPKGGNVTLPNGHVMVPGDRSAFVYHTGEGDAEKEEIVLDFAISQDGKIVVNV